MSPPKGRDDVTTKPPATRWTRDLLGRHEDWRKWLAAQRRAGHVTAVVPPVKTSVTHPLQVDFLPRDEVGLPGRIGWCAAPGRKDYHAQDGPWHRDLDVDLARLRERYRADQLITLLERGEFVRDELGELRIGDLLFRAKRLGLHAELCSMPGAGVVVATEQLFTLVERVLAAAAASQVVILHCRTGHGRSAVVVACCLCALGASVDEAVATVRALRPAALWAAADLQSLRACDRLWRTRLMERADVGDNNDVYPLFGSSSSTPGLLRAEPLAPLSQAGAATLSFDAAIGGAPMPPQLDVGDLFHVLPGRVLSFGSSPSCDISIVDRRLEPVHALVMFAAVGEGALLVADFGTKYGTRVCGHLVRTGYLSLGGELLLADAYRFRLLSIG